MIFNCQYVFQKKKASPSVLFWLSRALQARSGINQSANAYDSPHSYLFIALTAILIAEDLFIIQFSSSYILLRHVSGYIVASPALPLSFFGALP